MKIREITWTETYKEFEVGEKVKPNSNRCPLAFGVYTVTEFFPPLHPGDSSIVFVEGRLTGVSTEYLEGVI